MQLIIPMSGIGERFRRAGYTVPKPLIEVHGKTMIEHVLEMFDGVESVVAICNKDHLSHSDFDMAETILRGRPDAHIVGIKPHKLGPVHAILEAQAAISDSEPVVVSYCDYTCYWSYKAFSNYLDEFKPVGAIPAYRGFHPHSLGPNNYAYIKESNLIVHAIQEKKPFTSQKDEEFASSGAYYFESGSLMKTLFNRQIDEKRHVNGEYYVSLAYEPLLTEERVHVYPIQHFMQWGTPEDLSEYLYWYDAFDAVSKGNDKCRVPLDSVTILPMAGAGLRFKNEGYTIPKPLITVNGDPMVIQARSSLPESPTDCFVVRADIECFSDISERIKRTLPYAQILSLEDETNGQATTAHLGLTHLTKDQGLDLGAVTVAACDYSAIYSDREFSALLQDDHVDLIVWVATGFPGAKKNPTMYGWVEADEAGNVQRVTVKEPLSDPSVDPIVIGTFTFKNPCVFNRSYENMIAASDTVNGEFYIDSMVNHAVSLGFNCKIFTVDHWFCWGTPTDLKTYEYWQSCFHKWSGSKYTIDDDHRIPGQEKTKLMESVALYEP